MTHGSYDWNHWHLKYCYDDTLVLWLRPLAFRIFLRCKSHQHMITTTTAPCISVMHDICSCKSHQHMITNTTASCISVRHDICICKSHHHMITTTTASYISVIHDIFIDETIFFSRKVFSKRFAPLFIFGMGWIE